MKKLTPKYYFHIHHKILVEVLTEPLENRIKHIKENKPEDEIELRLRLIKPVKGKLSSEFIKADQAYVKANQAWDKANQAWDKARQAFIKASQAWDKADRDGILDLEKLHRVQCGCGYSFIRKTIFTKENGLVK